MYRALRLSPSKTGFFIDIAIQSCSIRPAADFELTLGGVTAPGTVARLLTVGGLMSRPSLDKIFRSVVVCLAICVVNFPASANIEITGNAFPLVNTPGNFAASGPVVIGINSNPPPSGNLIASGGSVLTSSAGTVGELLNSVGSASLSGAFWNMSGPLNIGLAGNGDMNASGN